MTKSKTKCYFAGTDNEVEVLMIVIDGKSLH